LTRPIVTGAGLRGSAQEVFGEQAKELGRLHVLDGEATILRHTGSTDSGGFPTRQYTPDDAPVPAHREPISVTDSTGREVADQYSEESTHRIWIRSDSALTTQDRIQMDGSEWNILALPTWNEPVLQVAEVKRGP
jgi:hypothetical protein